MLGGIISAELLTIFFDFAARPGVDLAARGFGELPGSSSGDRGLAAELLNRVLRRGVWNVASAERLRGVASTSLEGAFDPCGSAAADGLPQSSFGLIFFV